MRRYVWILVIILVFGIAIWMYVLRQGSSVPSNPTTSTIALDMVAQGGFVFVNTPADHKEEIGFMKEWTAPSCTVPHLDTTLVVDKGTVTDPPGAPPSPSYTITGAEVTIADSTPSANQAMMVVGLGKPSAPFYPSSTDTDDGWKNMEWVPNVSANGPSNRLASDWRTKVNGRFVLTNGTLQGGQPSDVAAKHGTWEFKSTNQPTTVAFKQAITDRVRYHVDLPDADVVLKLSGAPSGTPASITIRPSGGKVSLVLMGGHPSTAPPSIPVGARIDHFCAFYQLMDPVPAPGDWLYPHFAGLNPGTQVQTGSGSGPSSANPGFYCPGDSF
jgi:hypothetical protein